MNKPGRWRWLKASHTVIIDSENRYHFLFEILDAAVPVLPSWYLEAGQNGWVRLWYLWKNLQFRLGLLPAKRMPPDFASAVLRFMKAKVVLSYVDNDLSFYDLASKNPDIQFVSIQNGWRGRVADLFGELEEREPEVKSPLKCHTIAVFGPCWAREYAKHFDSEFLISGSPWNNSVPIASERKEEKRIVYISQYRPAGEDPDRFVNFRGKWISHSRYYHGEATALSVLARLCNEFGYTLSILPAFRRGDPQEEIDYFAGALQGRIWELLQKADRTEAYRLVDSSEAVFAADGSLGYECLSRGLKVGFLCYRRQGLGEDSNGFGWPLLPGETGAFWTNDMDEAEVERVARFVIGSSLEEYRKQAAPIIDELILYDPGNERLAGLLASLGCRGREAALNDEAHQTIS